MLHCYTFFHLNLMYSSIDISQHKEVVDKCYWPILKLAKQNVPIAIEAPAVTLECIEKADPSWIVECRKLLDEHKMEFIASGYTQLIGPLVPWLVNRWNFKLGNELYQEILGIQPKMGLVNEMAYSTGMIEHYVDAGYDAVAMEWNNPYKYHSEWNKEYQYHWQSVANEAKALQILWCNSIIFQKFQRYAHGETTLPEFVTYLQRHNSDHVRFLPLYSGDAEIFDFRPGRYSTEKKLGESSEWDRIFKLYQKLEEDESIQPVFPSEALADTNVLCGNRISLESAVQPIPVKKQEKYNIIRWALTGRADQQINTQCHRIFERIRESNESAFQKKLCFLWSSDFRTHIAESRWHRYLDSLDELSNEVKANIVQKPMGPPSPEVCLESFPFKNEQLEISKTDSGFHISSKRVQLSVNTKKGLVVDSIAFNESQLPVITTLKHGYYDDIAYGADFFSGHAIIEEAARHKVTNLAIIVPTVWIEGHTVCLHASVVQSDYVFSKQLECNCHTGEVTIHVNIQLPNRNPRLIRPIHFTLNPEAFDMETLFYATHNGGKNLETFRFNGRDIDHTEALSLLISSKYGLGATDGFVYIGDKNITLHFYHDNAMGYLIPSVKFVGVDENKTFLRLQYSAQEIDETFVPHEKPYLVQAKIRFGPGWGNI